MRTTPKMCCGVTKKEQKAEGRKREVRVKTDDRKTGKRNEGQVSAEL